MQYRVYMLKDVGVVSDSPTLHEPGDLVSAVLSPQRDAVGKQFILVNEDGVVQFVKFTAQQNVITDVSDKPIE